MRGGPLRQGRRSGADRNGRRWVRDNGRTRGGRERSVCGRRRRGSGRRCDWQWSSRRADSRQGRERRGRRRGNRARQRNGGAMPFEERASVQARDAGTKEPALVKDGRASGAEPVGLQAKVKVGRSAWGETEKNARASGVLQRSVIGAVNMGENGAAEDTEKVGARWSTSGANPSEREQG